MEPDDLLCSRNARPGKALVGRAQWRPLSMALPVTKEELYFSESCPIPQNDAACRGPWVGGRPMH
jgi:hypothetical protein